MNEEAGRGGDLMVTVRLESGEELPFIVDTGASGTLIDQSWEPKLGKSIGTANFQSWGVIHTNRIYVMPKLYLGTTPLVTGRQIISEDFKSETDGAGHRIMGILGLDVLENYCLQMDFAAGKVRFLDDERADKLQWGKAFPIVALNSKDARPAVAENLFGAQGPHSLIDSGCSFDGWLMPEYFQQWTNSGVPPAIGEVRAPKGAFGGETYPNIHLHEIDVESDGIGLHFLARHLVTLDFPKQTLYLQSQSLGPLPDPRFKSTRIPALDALIKAVLLEDVAAARTELGRLEKSNDAELIQTVARKLVASLENEPKSAPADLPLEIGQLALGDARPELAEVGWLKPTANRIPVNEELESPLLDSGKVFATGLFAHSPSHYVYELGGKWTTLRGEAGLHTAFQPYAFGVVFVIKTDGHEVFRSGIIRGSKLVHYEIDVAGVKELELLVEKAEDRNGGNWGLWLEPTLFREGAKSGNAPL